MKIYNYLFVLYLSVLYFSAIASGYGEESTVSPSHPNWSERESHALLNALRINPRSYLSSFFIPEMGNPGTILMTYPSQPPIYREETLTSSSVYHSNDMATHTGCTGHDDCDGGADFFGRIKRFINPQCNSYLGENVAAAQTSGLSANNMLICENYQLPCNMDGSNDGHRKNMMLPDYKAVGVGMMTGGQWGYYWTQDFSGCTIDLPTTPVHSGSHTYVQGELVFLADYYNTNGNTADMATVRFSNGVAYEMHLEYEDSGQLWTLRGANVTECMGYVFEFKGDDGIIQYPTTGMLQLLTKVTSNCKAWINTEVPESDQIVSFGIPMAQPSSILSAIFLLIVTLFISQF